MFDRLYNPQVLLIFLPILLSTFHIQRFYIKEYRLDRLFLFLRERYFIPLLLPIPRRMRISIRTLGTLATVVGIFVAIVYFSPMPLLVTIPLLLIFSFPFSLIGMFIFGIPIRLYHLYLIQKANLVIKATG